jgi:hypothetical protein
MKHACEKIKEVAGVDPLQPLSSIDIWFAPLHKVKDLCSKERRKLAGIKTWKLMIFDKDNPTRDIADIPIRFCPFCGEDLAPVGTKITAHLAITNIYPFVVSVSPQVADIIKACDEYNLKYFGMEWKGKPIRQVPITVEFMADGSVFDRPSVPIVHGCKSVK